MYHMTIEECWQFLAERPRPAILSSVRADGRPHATPVWIDHEGETIYSTTWHTSVKAYNIRRDPRVCLCVNDDMPPYAYVIIEATAELVDDREAVVYWATRLGGRYMGAELAEAFGKRNGVPGELLVRLTPTKILGHSNITD